MEQPRLEKECLEAFIRGDKRDAERLLPQILQPRKVMICMGTFVESRRVRVNSIEVYVNGSSLLHLAALHGWMDVVIDLITKYRCDVNCTGYRNEGRTPLHCASIGGHLEVVKYLINQQHCARDQNNKNTPLHYACEYGRLNIVQYIFNEHSVLTKEQDIQYLLHLACIGVVTIT